MKRLGLVIFGMLITMVFSRSVQAAKFKGYGRSPSGETMTVKEPLDRIVETPTEFLILLKRHSGFYMFPKKTEYTSQVREFLNSRLKSKKPIQIQIDPTTFQILNLSDAE